jgi:hypothetical protein
MLRFLALVSLLLSQPSRTSAADPSRTSAERGKLALESTAFIKAFWPKAAYDSAWKTWDVSEKPANYDRAFRERYGLHEAPYKNDGYPMGLRTASMLVGTGIGIDCMTCHGGRIHGKSLVGLGNASLDIHALFEEMAAASRSPVKLPFAFSQVRGTSEAGAFAVYLLGFRKPDLNISMQPRKLGLHDDSCEDVPAWWLLKKKRTMYHVGATDARSVRSIMQFMMHPLTTPQEFHRSEPAFRDILQYLLSLEAPKYPFAVDAKKAAAGKLLFSDHCARCHGTYGEKWTYPNNIIPLDEIGTDRKRAENIGSKFGEAYNESWFAKEPSENWFSTGKPVRLTAGYQAPPLDGIWATAPYFHNGSVPTLEGVLNSAARPKIFTRSYGTDEVDYDPVSVGWKVEVFTKAPKRSNAFEQRKIYDTTLPGRGNGGHPYGDRLSAEERSALIEYLKTL